MSKEFELARIAILQAAKSGLVDNIRAFAWAHRIYPLFPRELEEEFADDFSHSAAAVDNVLKRIDEGWRGGKLVTFYELEDAFGSRGMRGGSIDRMDLVAICRLAYLDDRFDEKSGRH